MLLKSPYEGTQYKINANLNISSKENASQKDKQDMLTELHMMKCLRSHNHIVQMIGYSTRTGEYMLLVQVKRAVFK